MILWPTRRRHAPNRILLAMLSFFLCASTGCKAAPAWPLWNAYATHFINTDGRVIDPSRGSITTSEGQSYAMFFALVENDRGSFDKLLNWTQDNLAQGDMSHHLPGWQWGKDSDGNWRLLDAGSASDSDCWIAYSLVEAGRLWQHKLYTDMGRAMLAMIAAREVSDLPGFGPMLMPGPSENFIHNTISTVNPSYVPMFLFERFAAVDPAGPWSAIAADIPKLVTQSSRGGFAMDWADYVPGKGFTPASGAGPAAPGTTAPDPVGSYDAIRVYLWAGMVNPAAKGQSALMESLSGMAAYLANHGAPPEKVSDQGTPLAQDGPVGFSAAVLPYLAATSGMQKAVSAQRARVLAARVASTGLYGSNPAYYDQNLVLFGKGFTDGRFSFSPGGELKVEWTH
jgi:endo-1,4-beta-D-glucanase Y